MRMDIFKALLDFKPLEEAAMAPDGRRTAVTVLDNYTTRDRGRQSRIWLIAADGATRQVTNGPGMDRLPRWSPDGAAIAFASDRDRPGLHALYLWREDDGETGIAPALDGSVEEICWSRDGATLLVLAADAGSDRAGVQSATRIEASGEGDGDPIVRRPRQAWRRLYLVDVASRSAREVSLPGLTAWECHWDGVSRAVAITSADPTESGWYDAFVSLIDLSTGRIETVYTPKGQLQNPRIAPGAAQVAFIEAYSSDRGTAAGGAVIVDVATRQALPVEADGDIAFLEWRDDATLWYAAWRGLSSTLGIVSVEGDVRELWSGDATVGSRYNLRVSASSDGKRLAAVVEDTARPPEVATFEPADREAGWRSVTTLNAGIAALDLPRARRVVWAGRDGIEIEGLLVEPKGVREGPAPMIVIVHGGPNLLWSHQFTNNARAFALAAEGFAVLLPNPRGSLGHGSRFTVACIGDYGGEDFQDILRGVDAMVEQGVADGARVGITGVSYGGFMSAWAVTQTDRFAASIPLACCSDWLSMHYTSNIPRFDEISIGARPREDPEAYLARSPVAHVDRARTPTMIVHGEVDLICPIGQALEFYQALAEVGVETELVIYPREGHYVLEWDHQVDLFNRMLAWFDRHLVSRDSRTSSAAGG